MPFTSFEGIQAVIFDLDGTLVTSSINFEDLQRKIGCNVGGDVLEFAAEHSDPNERARIMRIVEAAELADAETSQLIDGALEFMQAIKQKGIPMGIVTRNFGAAAKRKIERARLPIDFDCLITREDAPPKPAPDALLIFSHKWGLSPHHILYVGDYHFDVDAAHNAGMVSCLRLAEHSKGSDYAERAHYCFEDYSQFLMDLSSGGEAA